MINKIPIVAIVGSANAGKSSLFNRMLKTKQAIVAREAGTTRDNVIGLVNYKDCFFNLVDTAGLKDPQDDFEMTIQNQIAEAIDSADIIILVQDSTLYPINDDIKIARRILQSRKQAILVLNKIDLKNNLKNDDFLCLGIKDVVRTSAEHNSNVNKLLDEIVNNLPDKVDHVSQTDIKVSLIGRPNVGKSCLFNSIAGKQQAITSSISGTTRDVGKTTIKYDQKTIDFMDTAGIRRPGRQDVGIEKFSVIRSLEAINNSDICLLVIDATELNTQLDQKLAGIISDSGRGLIIVINKYDLVDNDSSDNRDSILDSIKEKFNFVPWASLVFTSALTGLNVTKIFDLLLKITDLRAQKLKTSQLNKVLQDAVKAHPPAGLKNTHPKLRYIVQTDFNPPWFVVYGSSLSQLHWSYKRFLERKIRENFDYSGTPIKFSFINKK